MRKEKNGYEKKEAEGKWE